MSAFSRPSGFMEVSEEIEIKDTKNKQNNLTILLQCKWVYTGHADVFIVWLHDFCGLQPHTLRTADKSARKQF